MKIKSYTFRNNINSENINIRLDIIFPSSWKQSKRRIDRQGRVFEDGGVNGSYVALGSYHVWLSI